MLRRSPQSIHDLSRIGDEPLFQRLYAEGHTVQFVDAALLREFASTGWEPVTGRMSDGRPVIFADRHRELLLVHRPKQQ